MKTTFLCLLVSTFVSVSTLAKENPKAINIASKGDQLVFDKTSLTAKPNQPIKLVFKNGAAKNSGLQHNWVLVKPGTLDAISAASIAAGVDKGWLADSPDILAHTKLLNPGETETVTFNAPSTPGDYPYFCSFPGHSSMMKGILHVK